MPTTGELRRTIAAKLDYDPELAAYNVQVYRLLNEVQQYVIALAPWTFAMATAQVRIRSDLAFGTVAATNGSRTVTGTGTGWSVDCEEAELLMPDDNWYRVGRYVSSTSLELDVPYGGTTFSGTKVTTRFRFVPLPTDCVGYANIEARSDDRGQLHYVNRAREERVYLDEDVTGDPTHFTDADTWSPRTPERALTGAASGGGALVDGRTYQYRYSYKVHGIESGLSDTVEVTPSGANLSVTLSGWIDTAAGNGRQRVLYRAEKDVGIFYRLTTGTGTGALTDDGSTYTPDRDAVANNSGLRHYVRFYPRPGAPSALGGGKNSGNFNEDLADVRYHARPRLLQKDSDVPQLPEEFHDLLVNGTLAELSMKFGQPGASDHYRALFLNRLSDLRTRYLEQKASRTIRRPWTSAGGPWQWMWGTPSKTT